MKTLEDIGEIALVKRIRAGLRMRDDVIVGPGDDCAVVRGRPDDPQDLLLTSDATIEGIHFTPGTDGRRVGRKALARVLSDIAAMGGDPAWALVDLVAPPSTDAALVDALYQGMSQWSERYGCPIVGGDVAAGPVVELHVFACGHVPRGQALTRAGASAGDMLCVTGSLGGSRSGRHLDFEPRLAHGRLLRGLATACMDLSDGLAADLPRMVEASGVGCILHADRIPISDDAQHPTDGRSPLEHAWSDGEDFELLFALPPEKAEALQAACHAAGLAPFRAIGILTDQPERIYTRGGDGRLRPFETKGYVHFE